MATFKELALQEAMKFNYDIDGNGNPYKDLDNSKLKKKKKSFEGQLSDLRSKVMQASLGSGGNKKGYFREIEEIQLKLDQVNYILKGAK